jgi:hypothetical protein
MVSETTYDTSEIMRVLNEVKNKEDAFNFLNMFECMSLTVEEDRTLDFKRAWIETLNTTDNEENTIMYFKYMFSSLMEEQ